MQSLPAAAALISLTSCFALASCGDMEGDEQVQGSPEARAEFLNLYAQRTGVTGKGYLTLHDDGVLEYVEHINPHCTFDFAGRIELIGKKNNGFEITYRYTSFQTGRRYCGPKESNCRSDLAQCDQEENKLIPKMGDLKKAEVPEGAPPAAVRLLPY